MTSNNVDMKNIPVSHLKQVLLTLIDEDYASELAFCENKPFTIGISVKDGEWCWTVACFGRKACQNMLLPLADRRFNSFDLPGEDNISMTIVRKKVIKRSVSDIVNGSVSGVVPYRFTLSFVTPTVFDDNGRFVFFPDIYLIYTRLIKRSKLVSDKISFADKETFEELVKATSITAYDIHTTRCFINGDRITGFIGRVTFRINGPEMMRGYAGMLFGIAEFTGVGEGCSQGLGTVVLEKEEGIHGRHTDKNNA